MFSHFVIYAHEIDYSIQLYNRFLPRYGNATLSAYALSLNSKITINTSYWVGLVSGLLALIVVLILINRKLARFDANESTHDGLLEYRKLVDESSQQIPVTIFLSYIAIFCVFAYLSDPYMLQRFIDIIYAVVPAGIISLSAFLYIKHCKNFYAFESKNTSAYLKFLELEFRGYETKMNAALSAMVSLLIGCIIVVTVQTSFGIVPIEVLMSRENWILLLGMCLWMFIIYGGMFFGIIYQLTRQMGRILEQLQDMKDDPTHGVQE